MTGGRVSFPNFLPVCFASGPLQDGCTALMLAAKGGDMFGVRLLVEAGANKEAANKVRGISG